MNEEMITEKYLDMLIQQSYSNEEKAGASADSVADKIAYIKDQILQDRETVKRLHETGYIISKFQLDETYTQTAILEMFKYIINSDTLKWRN